jgi:acyl-coenzyme A thioesterase PaaI-like protein
VDLRDHPQIDRFLRAARGHGFERGDELPYHQPNCFGCGPDNDRGFGLTVVAAERGAVEATCCFEPHHEGGPGVAHGGAIAAVIDEVLGRVLVRELVVAVTAELSLEFLRAVHLDDPCRISARLTGHQGRDLTMAAVLEQHEVEKVTARARFREIDLERVTNRYERLDPAPAREP